MRQTKQQGKSARWLFAMAFGLSLLNNSHNATAQSSLSCIPPPASTGSSSSFTTPCVPTSAVFHSFYKYQQNYIPENSIVKALSVHKDINIVINIVNPSLPGGPIVNYQNTATDRNYIEQIVAKMNDKLTNMEVPSDPVTAVCGSNCRIVDSRFRINLKGIYFLNSDNKFDDVTFSSDPDYFKLIAPVKDGVLNIFIYDQNPANTLGALTFKLPNATELVNGVNDVYNVIVAKEYYPYKTYIDNLAANLLHEIGHTMGLSHMYELEWGQPGGTIESGDASSLDYLDDVFGPVSSQIYPRPYEKKDCSDPFLSSNDDCTNNLMGSFTGFYLSPKQIGRMHRNAYFLSCRNFISNTEPEDVNHEHKGQGQNYPLVINNTELWDFDIKMYNDIVVKNGATLTISCKVLMPYHANIIVEPGGNLVIDGGMITSHDKNTMWYGISVWGQSGESQDIPGKQGKLIMKNGARIENALHAAVMGDEVFRDYSRGGGIANIQNSYFYNNRHSVGFWEYHNHLSTSSFVFKPNRSVIYNSTFLIDDNLQRSPHGQIQLWNVEGVKIMGCNLESKLSHARSLVLGDVSSGGRGIIGSGANFIVSDLCPDPTTTPCSALTATPSSIKGFGDAVLAETFGFLNNFTVKNTTFFKNGHGIVTNNVNFAKIYNNKFELDENKPLLRTFGINTYASTGFHIYLNDFNCAYYPDANDVVGLTIRESGSDDNEVYKNTFKNVHIGASADGVNSNGVDMTVWENNKGLQFLCNTYRDVYFNEWVYGTNLTDHGIRYNQASPLEPTGNKHIATRRYNLGRSGSHDYTYYYSSDPLENPTALTAGVTKIKLSKINTCDLRKGYEPPYNTGDGSEEDDGSTGFTALMAAYNDSTSIYRTERIDAALVSMHSAYADIDRSILWLQNGQIAKGYAIYDSIATKYSLLPTEQAEFVIGRRVIQLLAHHYQQSIAMANLSSGEVDSLHYIVANSKMWPRAKACNWLRFALGEECSYSLPPSPPSDSNNFNGQRTISSQTNQEKNNSFLMIPNPSRHNFELSYTLAIDEDAELVVRDVTGRIVSTMVLKAENHTATLVAEQWTSGLYFYTVSQHNNSLSNGKLVKY